MSTVRRVSEAHSYNSGSASSKSHSSYRLEENSDDGLENRSTVQSSVGIDETHIADCAEIIGYENEFGVANTEECEEGFECYKDKKGKFNWSKSLLEEDRFPEMILTADEAGKCLSRVAQVGNGLLYAYIQIDVDHRYLTDIEEIANFNYLSLINVSHNRLDLNSLNVLRALEYVVVVQADHNAVESLCLSPMPYLQVLTLNSNRVSSLSGLKQPSLERLELNDNRMSYLVREPRKSVDGDYCNQIDCPQLTTLSLSRNALETVEQFMLVSIKLRTLYLSYNKIVNLRGLDRLSNLSYLHLRANHISNLEGITANLNQLTYLNLRENRLRNINELNKLSCLKSLKVLALAHNDFKRDPTIKTSGDFTLRSIVLKKLPWLERIDKGPVTVSEVNEASVYEYGAEEPIQADEEDVPTEAE